MNSWQDIVLAVSTFAFNLALIPSVRGKSKPELITSVVTVIFILANIVAFISLSLWFTVVMVSINCLLWATLAVQKFKIIKNTKVSDKPQ